MFHFGAKSCANLGVVVVVVTMAMVMLACGESRRGTHQHQKGGKDELFHVLQASTILEGVYATKDAGIKTTTGSAHGGSAACQSFPADPPKEPTEPRAQDCDCAAGVHC
jgi:hypothetical protein